MKPIPETDNTPFLRTDFSDDVAWRAICSEIREPAPEYQEGFAALAAINASLGQGVGELQAYVNIIDDPEYAGMTIEQLLELVPAESSHTFLFIVDRLTVSHADHPILVVDLYGKRGRSFRTAPAQVQAIQNNLSIANMDWEDFANLVDKDGIFRGLAG